MNSDDEIGKIYTNKGLELIETPIHKFTKDHYIPEIYKLALNLAHVHILGKTNTDQQENMQ